MSHPVFSVLCSIEWDGANGRYLVELFAKDDFQLGVIEERLRVDAAQNAQANMYLNRKERGYKNGKHCIRDPRGFV